MEVSTSQTGQTSQASISDMLAAASERVMERCGLEYDETAGMYYDANSALYYDQVCTCMCRGGESPINYEECSVCVCVCVCVYVCEGERERERECVCVKD